MFHMQERQVLLSSLFKKKTSIMPLGVFLVYIFYSLSILYKAATSYGTNAVIVTSVHCI